MNKGGPCRSGGNDEGHGETFFSQRPLPPSAGEHIRLKQAGPSHEPCSQGLEDGSLMQKRRFAARRHVGRSREHLARHHQQQDEQSDQKKGRPPGQRYGWGSGRGINSRIGVLLEQNISNNNDQKPACVIIRARTKAEVSGEHPRRLGREEKRKGRNRERQGALPQGHLDR